MIIRHSFSNGAIYCIGCGLAYYTLTEDERAHGVCSGALLVAARRAHRAGLTPEPEPAPTLDSVTREHSDRLHTAYVNRTFGANSELGTFMAYLFDLRDKGLITIPSWDQ